MSFKQAFATLRSVFQSPHAAPASPFMPTGEIRARCAALLNRPVPGSEPLLVTFADVLSGAELGLLEIQLLLVEVATLELLLADAREEVDFLKGYPHGKG